MLKYLAYCRKSTDDKEKQILSIEAQVEELKEFALRENLQVVDWIVESKSAKFPSFWFDNTPQGKFMLNIAFGQSKYYIDNLSENVKRGMRQKIRRGEWPGKAPYGYFNNRQTRTVDIDLNTCGTVKKAYELFSSGDYSFTDISLFMAGKGMTRGNGKPVSINQVTRMFRNPFYKGLLKYNGLLHEGKHDRFISNALFERVQKVMKRKTKVRFKGNHFAFVGLATCGECGACITAEKHCKYYLRTKRKARYVYYRCTKKLKPCSQGYLPEADFAHDLRQAVRKYSLHPDWKSYIDKWIEEKKEEEGFETKAKVEKLSGDLKRVEDKSSRLLDLYLNGGIDEKGYREKHNQLFERKRKIGEQMANLESKGFVWLEPLEQVVKCAILAHKIAQKKGESDQLRAVAENIGSNFFLKDKKLSFNPKIAYRLLSAGGGAASEAPSKTAFFQIVSHTGLEPFSPITTPF
ncbi:MAG: recombinase family protein [Candidatus Shapirobacteria bacterium]